MTMQDAYERYYGSQHYDDRYPRPNLCTLDRITALTPAQGAVLDIGAGNGRYSIPLAHLGYEVLTVERSDEARTQLMIAAERSGVRDRITSYKDVLDVPDEEIARCEAAFLLFGVLGHMSYRERNATLDLLHRLLPPDAVIAGSVPNRFRRFRHEQRLARLRDDGRAPRFRYSRSFADETHTFEYTAFSPSELVDDLLSHGWQCRSLGAESVLTESAATRNAVLGVIDRGFCRIVPVPFGYCIYFSAVKLT